MSLTQDQINQFKIKAKAAGFSDADIAAEVARKQQEVSTPQPASGGMDISSPGFAQQSASPAPVAPTTPAPEKGGLVASLKGAAKWVGDTFFPATKNFVQDVTSSAVQNSKDYQDAVKSTETAMAGTRKLVEQAKKTTDPATKERLIKLAREQSAALGKSLEEIVPEFSKDAEKGYVDRGLAVGAEIASAAMTPTAGGKTAVQRTLQMGKQGAEIAAARSATSLEDMTPEERLKKTFVDAGLGALTVGGLQAGGEVISKLSKGSKAAETVGQNITKKGSEIRSSVRKVREPAGVWGASKEEAINGTLDTMKIEGTAAEQYTQLEPAYEKMNKAIKEYLDTGAKPVITKDLQTAVQKDLADIPGDVLAEPQGAKEFEKIVKEISKIKDSKDLFATKKWLNGRLGRVYTKLEKGNPLSPAEEVLLQARDTVDSAMTTLHPEIKELTIRQSHLRDAAPSLARARLVVPTQRIAGTTIPTSVTQKATDMAGKAIQKTGQVVEKAGKGGEAVFGFAQKPVETVVKAGQKAAPVLVTPATPFENVQDMTQNPQGNKGNIDQNNGSNSVQSQPDHKQNIPQTVTGHTVEEHMTALSKAKAVGDTESAKAIQAQLDIEQEYQKSQPKAKPLTAAQKVTKTNADSGLRALSKMEKELGMVTGADGTATYSNKGRVWKAAVPGALGARQFATARKEAVDVITRLRTGAALTKEEADFYISQFPSPLDNDADIAYKMSIFRDLFTALANPDGAATLEDQLGGFTAQ